MPIATIESSDSFEAELRRPAGGLCMAYFHADWAPQCHDMWPAVEILAKKYPFVACLSVDVDKNNSLVLAYKIPSVPAFLFFKVNALIVK